MENGLISSLHKKGNTQNYTNKILPQVNYMAEYVEIQQKVNLK